MGALLARLRVDDDERAKRMYGHLNAPWRYFVAQTAICGRMRCSFLGVETNSYGVNESKHQQNCQLFLPPVVTMRARLS
jgi:hypothetical protein